MNTKNLIIMSILIVIGGQAAQLSAGGPGAAACISLAQPVSAKSAGMNNAYSALSGDIVSLHYNPAGIARMTQHELSALYRRGFAEDTYASLLCGFKFPDKKYALGASVLMYDSGTVDIYNPQGEKFSKIGQRDLTFTLGLAMPSFIENVNCGFSIKGISSEIFGNSASAVAGDFGLQYCNGYTLAASIHNIGSKINYLNRDESLPEIIRVGIMKNYDFEKYSLITAIDFPHYIQESETLTLVGLELNVQGLYYIRGGYKYNFAESSRDDEQSVTGGMGVQFGNFSIDYALGITDDLDIPHTVSLGLKFGAVSHIERGRDTYIQEDDADDVFFKRRTHKQIKEKDLKIYDENGKRKQAPVRRIKRDSEAENQETSPSKTTRHKRRFILE
ncbi:MAG: PorV/PorQ family protein [Elusimicrobia bacterium]|nr:PorV/PorQ family protein [Elusimicrobiota bacterium]